MGSLIKRLFVGGESPHNLKILEVERVPHPDKPLDAVLVGQGGRNFVVFVVKRGRSVHATQHAVALYHCQEDTTPSLAWKGSGLEIRGHCEIASANQDIEMENPLPGVMLLRSGSWNSMQKRQRIAIAIVVFILVLSAALIWSNRSAFLLIISGS